MQADEGTSDAQVSNGYQIQVTECTHGTVTPSVEQAEQGDTVTLTVKPWGGYSLKSLKAVYTQDGAEKEITIAEDNTFTMPDAEVTVTAEFEQTAWLTSIEFGVDKNGTNPVSVELQPGVTDYEVRTNSWDYDNKSFYWKLALNQEYDGVLIKYPVSNYQDSVYKAKLQNEWESLSSFSSKYPKNFSIKLTPENTLIPDEFDNIYAVEYNFALYRKASVKALELGGAKRTDFQRDKFEYSSIVDADKTEYEIKATGYANAYDISAGDITVKSAETISLPLNWDTDGKMDVDLTVSGEGLISTVYKLHLIKERIEDTPFIKEQPVGGQKYAGAVKAEDTTALSTVASANGTLSYQWYRNTANSYEGSQAIAGATESSYHPEFDGTENGAFYYYCAVTNTNESGSFTTNTELVPVMVFVDPTPKNVKITYADGSELPAEGLYYNVWDEVKLGAQYEVDELLKDDVDITYCYVDDQGRTYLTSYTDAWNLYNKHGYLYCTATVKINGKSYTGYSKADEDPGIEFTVCTTEAITQSKKATISAQGTDMEYVVGGEDMLPLAIGMYYNMSSYGSSANNANVDDQTVNSWQWMVSEDGIHFTDIDSDSARGISDLYSGVLQTISYVPEASDTVCKRYYKCRFKTEVTSYNGNTYRTYTDSDIINVSFVEIEGFEGAGTKESPYLIQSVDDLTLLAKCVNEKKQSFSGKTVKLTTDLTLPEGWTQIGTDKNGSPNAGKDMIPFSGTFDGGGHTITVPAGGKTVFKRVREAKICNLNIYGPQITGFGLVDGYVVDYGPDGNYQTGVPKTVTISNCKLLKGTQTLASGFIGGGGSGLNEITIQDSEIEVGVTIGYNGKYVNIGSFAGLFNGTIKNCKSYADVYGSNYVGGIMGCKAQSMGPCRIIGCHFGGTVTATGKFVGGIAGDGYDNQSAPNSPCVTLQYNSCDGTISGADNVGGIFGGEGGVVQCWSNGIGYIQNNQFTGTLIAPEGANVGGIIGYMRSIDRYNVIENNYWKTGCGATSGIGKIESIDTTSKDYGVEKDFVVDEVCIPSSAEEMPDISKAVVTDLILEGEYKTTYYLGEELDLTGMVLTAQYSNGTETHPSLSEVTVSGYDKNKHGEQTVTVKYGDAVASFLVLVLKKSNDTITVSFTLLGDKVHDASKDGEIHALKNKNLTTWVAEKKYEVNQNANVKEVLEKVLAENNMTCSNPTGNYVESITNGDITLGEFDNGVRTSGWMYTLNGTYPDLGVKQQYLNDGDVIIFHFTDDYNLEHQHRWKTEWSYDETGHWHACDDWCPITDNTRKDGYALHSWDAGTITKAATCAQNGVKIYHCECGAVKTETIKTTGHKYGSWVTTSKATVSAQAVQTRTCSVCKKKETRKVGGKLKPAMTVNLSTVPLKVKQKTSVLRVTGLANGDKVQSYKSGNTKIFTVSKSGAITAGKKTGKANLTITLASGLKKNITVKVQKNAVATTKITGLQSKITLKKGQKLTLKPGRQPLTSTQKFTYKSSGKKIATVNSKGVITAKKEGTTKITVKSGKKKFTVTVTVTK